MDKFFYVLIAMAFLHVSTYAQPCYWQQKADYSIDFDLNTKNHRFTGSETLTYTNNSPDTLQRVFFHLYFNAFQPGSMMDIRSQNIADPDRRVGNRIAELKDDEIGYQRVTKLLQNEQPLSVQVKGTLLEATLTEPILPGETHTFSLDFSGQVPKQIRRSGRDNAERIDYSMAQWYPKIAEYDQQGWHAYEYIGREFHSPWGDYEVNITIDADYIIGASGVLQNKDEIGHGYTPKKVKHARDKRLTWRFAVDNVIDFVWAADPDYTHVTKQVPGGPLVHFFYQNNEKTKTTWPKMIDKYTIPLFQTMIKKYGEYPYPVYSVIQGGDGGMEYPLATLINGEGSFQGLFGVINHELAHSWFQMMLATNEALYPWMDEGMTNFADGEVYKEIFNKKGNVHAGAYKAYLRLVNSGLNEPATQHSDHYNTNFAYSVASYYKGELFMQQLRYIIGEDVFDRAMKRYVNTWRFKHPTPNDFIRIMEKESGMQLQWFMRNWFNTTRTIDYAIEDVKSSELTEGALTIVTVKSEGLIQMPVELTVTYNDGRPEELIYIPLNEQFGEKTFSTSTNVRSLTPWNWVNPTYKVVIHGDISTIDSIKIDADNEVADVQRENNVWEN